MQKLVYPRHPAACPPEFNSTNFYLLKILVILLVEGTFPSPSTQRLLFNTQFPSKQQSLELAGLLPHVPAFICWVCRDSLSVFHFCCWLLHANWFVPELEPLKSVSLLPQSPKRVCAKWIRAQAAKEGSVATIDQSDARSVTPPEAERRAARNGFRRGNLQILALGYQRSL